MKGNSFSSVLPFVKLHPRLLVDSLLAVLESGTQPSMLSWVCGVEGLGILERE